MGGRTLGRRRKGPWRRKGQTTDQHGCTDATTGLEQAATIADMAELLGHSDTKMLSEHYGRLSQKTERMREIAKQVSGKQESGAD